MPTDTLLHGVGHPAAHTGMVRSSFRPSDDSTTFPFLVPSNAMAVVELRAVALMLRSKEPRRKSMRTAVFAERKEELASRAAELGPTLSLCGVS